MVAIPGTPAMCRVATSYTRQKLLLVLALTIQMRTTGTFNGSTTPYTSSLPSSAIKIPSFDWDKGNMYSDSLRFRIDLDSILHTPTYASLTAKDQIALIVHWMDPEM